MFQYSPILGHSSIWDLKYTFSSFFFPSKLLTLHMQLLCLVFVTFLTTVCVGRLLQVGLRCFFFLDRPTYFLAKDLHVYWSPWKAHRYKFCYEERLYIKGVLYPDTKISMFCLFSPSSRRKSILFMYGCDRCVWFKVEKHEIFSMDLRISHVERFKIFFSFST